MVKRPRDRTTVLPLPDDSEIEEVEAVVTSPRVSPHPAALWAQRDWKERYSLEFFANYTALELAGSFHSVFWRRILLNLSHHEPLIIPMVTALGAMHEGSLRSAAGDPDSDRHAFAAKQCNIAVNQLIKRNKPGGTKPVDPRVVLSIAICIGSYEGIRCDLTNAVTHDYQCRKLLRYCQNLAVQEERQGRTSSSRIPLSSLEAAVDRLQLLTHPVPVGELIEMDRCGEVPEVLHFTDLAGAYRMLRVIFKPFQIFLQNVHDTPARRKPEAEFEKKRIDYADALDRWHAAFKDFLSVEERSLSEEQTKRAKILEVNCIYAQILATVDIIDGVPRYKKFTEEFRRIVDLCQDMLQLDDSPSAIATTNDTRSKNFPGYLFQVFGLWVHEPLYFTAASCFDIELAERAGTTVLTYWGVANRSGANADIAFVREWNERIIKVRLDYGLAAMAYGAGCQTPEQVESNPTFQASVTRDGQAPDTRRFM